MRETSYARVKDVRGAQRMKEKIKDAMELAVLAIVAALILAAGIVAYTAPIWIFLIGAYFIAKLIVRH